jgi:hypothetical protein
MACLYNMVPRNALEKVMYRPRHASFESSGHQAVQSVSVNFSNTTVLEQFFLLIVLLLISQVPFPPGRHKYTQCLGDIAA